MQSKNQACIKFRADTQVRPYAWTPIKSIREDTCREKSGMHQIQGGHIGPPLRVDTNKFYNGRDTCHEKSGIHQIQGGHIGPPLRGDAII